MPIPPRYQCTRCEDWGIVVAPSGRGTVQCPGTGTTPCTAPKPPKKSTATSPRTN
jgi:hypothetical protein